MAGDYVIATYTAAAVTASMVAVSNVPALTGAGAPEARNAEQIRYINDERSYCEAYEHRVDCVCFAKKAGYLLEHEFTRARGAHGRDREDIARGQARNSCRTGV